MLAILDVLDAFYLGSFLFGLVFATASHLLGAVHVGGGGRHGSGQAHAAHVAGPAGLAHGVPWRSLLNPGPLLAFVTWFGGIGYQGRHLLDLASPASLACAAVGGGAGAGIVWWVMERVVLPNERALDPDDFRLEGVPARVSSGIRAGGVGEIVYELQGTRWVCAARAIDAESLPKGCEVVIRAQERGVAAVERAGAAISPP